MGHAASLPIHYHASMRQIEHASTNHQLHGQRHTPQRITSVLCVSAKSAQNQSIQWVLWGLKGIHPDMQVMSQGRQSTAMHLQGKWNTPSPTVSSMDRHTQQCIISVLCASPKTQNQPIGWVLSGQKGMYPDMQVMSQGCSSVTMHPQGALNVLAPIISSMDRGAHHNVSFLSCAFLPNVPKTSPSAGCCEA